VTFTSQFGTFDVSSLPEVGLFFQLLVGQLWVKSAEDSFDLLHPLALFAIRLVGRVVGGHDGALL
jgi:hypothetical protein